MIGLRLYRVVEGKAQAYSHLLLLRLYCHARVKALNGKPYLTGRANDPKIMENQKMEEVAPWNMER